VILPAIFLFAFGSVFGYAKPVPVNPRYFKDQRKGMMLTSLAGPFSNFLMAAMGSVLLAQGLLVSIKFILGAFIFINVLLGVFNLIPIPPLDGSKILEGVLPRAWLTGYYKFENIVERYFMIIMILIIVLRPGILSNVLFSVIKPILRLLGVESIV
ncbi:MAG TPA: site-2 protease family protein, partial [Actinobacteria bacterium]|nr:site-2 protease family protein [Actinomycetota bacterium]